MPQGLIRIVMPLLMVLVFLLYVLFNLPGTQTPDTPADADTAPASAAPE